MSTNAASLSAGDLQALTRIEKIWVCASYWDDETIKRYLRLGLVTRVDDRLALTEAGKQAMRSRGITLSSSRPETASPLDNSGPAEAEDGYAMNDDIPRKGVGSQEELWILSADRRSLRMELPPLPIGGLLNPLRLLLDFDVGATDQMLERLLGLRAEMLPPTRSRTARTP